MSDRAVTSVERLARQICKMLPAGVAADPGLLRTLASQPVYRALSPKWRRQLQESAGDFERAVALAVSKGWLSATGGSMTLTPAGARLALRSRVGQRRRRFSALSD
jgi:hypothetical protein